MSEFELLCSIVNHEHGSKVLRIGRRHGALGGTIFLARGTVRNRLLELLDLSDVRKEVVLMAAEKDFAREILESVAKDMALHKPGHGITFSFSLKSFVGKHHAGHSKIQAEERENAMYTAIFTVVDKGRAEEVVEASIEAGARGGTIINARGAGVHETAVLFAMPVEPEKEIVLTLVEAGGADTVMRAVTKRLRIDEPGNGVIFTVDASHVIGLA